MISTQDCTVQRRTFGGGNLPCRCPDCARFLRSPTPVLGQHDRNAAAGLGYPDAQMGTLARDGVLHAEAAR